MAIKLYLLIGILTSIIQAPVLPASTAAHLYSTPAVLRDSGYQLLQGSAVDFLFNDAAATTTITALDYASEMGAVGALHASPVALTCWGISEAACLAHMYAIFSAAEARLVERYRSNRVISNTIVRTGGEVKILIDVLVRDLYRMHRNALPFLQAFFCNLYIVDRLKRLI